MAFGTFLRANPALAPLFLFAGGGCAAAVRTHPEIQIDRKNNPFPWVRVQQHENIKFITSRPEFYESRKNVERPSF
ncbi:hypothetical protein DFQ28_011621 [Apophysomyces sp. BC1034]|nr:hypothetical protein DFQ28_011621 [Apophysomyces sp. BC1034]